MKNRFHPEMASLEIEKWVRVALQNAAIGNTGRAPSQACGSGVNTTENRGLGLDGHQAPWTLRG
jgi:hypothetical protein